MLANLERVSTQAAISNAAGAESCIIQLKNGIIVIQPGRCNQNEVLVDKEQNC